jgi:ferredoxin
MSQKVNPRLIEEIRKFGAFDITACFNCGNCTAVCPLSMEDAAFPRRLIRYAHLGLERKLLDKKEVWLCYYCGKCSETCPREAEPGEFMAAARRYAIARSDVTGLTRFLYKSPVFNLLFTVLLACFFALFIYTHRVPLGAGKTTIEVFHIPFRLIHEIGIGVIVFAAVAFLIGLVRMSLRVFDRKEVVRLIRENPAVNKHFRWVADVVHAALTTVFREAVAFKRYRDCDAEEPQPPLLLRPWFLHASVAWGFVGLVLATVLDYFFKNPEARVPVWYPPRLIGTIAGLLLVYGASVIILNRLRRKGKRYANGTFSDWWFIVLLWVVGVCGFALEILDYLPHVPPTVADTLFVVHVAPAMVLVVLAAFTKLAHVFYRPLALFFYGLKEDLKS